MLTCVYYCNPDWKQSYGGYLRAYYRHKFTEKAWDIAPEVDTLVIFRSKDMEHEVLPTYRDRFALTVWFYGSGLQKTNLRQPKCLTLPYPDTIYVGIASYRDSECIRTVQDIFARAAHPDRIFVGICLQCEADDPDYKAFCDTYTKDRVKITWLHYREASGPCPARSRAQALWKNEKYYLQIDSHMRFAKNWDAFLVAELARCPSEKAILTTYSPGYNPSSVLLSIQRQSESLPSFV